MAPFLQRRPQSFTLDIQPASRIQFANAPTGAGRASFLPPMAFRARPPRGRGELTVRLPRATPAGEMELPEVQGTGAAVRWWSSMPVMAVMIRGPFRPLAAGTRKMRRLPSPLPRATRWLASGRVRVALTRDDDRFLILRERYEIARRLGAASCSFRSMPMPPQNREARGATIYTLSEVASDQETARLASRENSADIINGVNLGGADDDVRSILIDLTQRETMNISARFAALLRREAWRYICRSRSDYHRFRGLCRTQGAGHAVGSVRIRLSDQCGRFPADLLARLASDAIARGLADAIETHFARRDHQHRLSPA